MAPRIICLEDGGKRIRPVLCLLGNELFGPIIPDTWKIAVALELFHNFTLIHDDIMDKAPLRRGRPTVHAKYNESTALLAGDVMLLQAYDYLNETDPNHVQTLIRLLNNTGREVCEGQQLDMDFEKNPSISLSEYLHMIELKTAVLLAGSLQMGAIAAGAGQTDQQLIYDFGKNLGLAFQVQDDWLDAFGDPSTFGKLKGGGYPNICTQYMYRKYRPFVFRQTKNFVKIISIVILNSPDINPCFFGHG
ncbi:MAG: polyprenyl synthetase family protein [Puia sp.]